MGGALQRLNWYKHNIKQVPHISKFLKPEAALVACNALVASCVEFCPNPMVKIYGVS